MADSPPHDDSKILARLREESRRIREEGPTDWREDFSRRVFKERAAALGREPGSLLQSAQRTDLLCKSGGKSYLFDSEDVEEVAQIEFMTPVPTAPPYLCGLVNLRGDLVPLVHLESFLEGTPPGVKVGQSYVVMRCGSIRYGLIVDSVFDLHSVMVDTTVSPAGPPIAFLDKVFHAGEILSRVSAGKFLEAIIQATKDYLERQGIQ